MRLKDFSLMEENGDHYVIGHTSGRSIKIMKSGLSSASKDHIQAMNKGGVLSKENKKTEMVPEKDRYAEGGEVNSSSVDDPANFGIPEEATQQSSSAVPIDQERAPAAQADAPQPAAAPAQAPAQDAAQYPDSSKAIQNEIGAIQAGTQAEAKVGKDTAQAYGDAIKSVQQLQQAHEQRTKEFNLQDKAMMDQLQSQKIDPHRYFNNQSTGSKILSGVALALGGIGSGLTGQPNAALSVIHDAIDKDIEAQKNDQSKSMNLWKMNREKFQDETQANLATQNQLLNVARLKAIQAQSVAQGPEAAARSAAVVGQLTQEMQMNNYRRSLLSGQGSGEMKSVDPAQLVPVLVKDPAQQKQVYEEIGRAQNVTKNSDKILKAFDDSTKENTVLRTGAGMLRTPGSVMALHQLMLPNFKQIDGTVRQAAMDESFHNLTPAPGDDQHKIDQKRQALVDWMHSETAAPTAKGNGIDLSRYLNTSGGNSNQVKTMNGVPYQLGKDGNYHRVK